MKMNDKSKQFDTHKYKYSSNRYSLQFSRITSKRTFLLNLAIPNDQRPINSHHMDLQPRRQRIAKLLQRDARLNLPRESKNALFAAQPITACITCAWCAYTSDSHAPFFLALRMI